MMMNHSQINCQFEIVFSTSSFPQHELGPYKGHKKGSTVQDVCRPKKPAMYNVLGAWAAMASVMVVSVLNWARRSRRTCEYSWYI